MISKIADLNAWVALIVIVLIKFIQLYGVLSLGDLIIRLILWGLCTFILMRILGRVIDGIINLFEREASSSSHLDLYDEGSGKDEGYQRSS